MASETSGFDLNSVFISGNVSNATSPLSISKDIKSSSVVLVLGLIFLTIFKLRTRHDSSNQKDYHWESGSWISVVQVYSALVYPMPSCLDVSFFYSRGPDLLRE
jgi:hypothetical protein